MYAIIESGGKQYRVAEGDVIRVERLAGADGDAVVLDRVLAVAKDGSLNVGSPYLDGAKVTATLLAQGKGKKIRVFKYHNKTNYRVRQGHRQPFSKLKIDKIEA